MPARIPVRPLSRRSFLGHGLSATAALAGASVLPLTAAEKSPNEKLSLAFVGVGGKGWDNIQNLRHETVAVLCDVDANTLDKAAHDFPKATRHRDWRKMLDAEHRRIDAVVVSTADHTHAGPTALALTLGKHVYCEKPLTHTVREARHVTALAGKSKLVTQMGTQIHAGDNYRRVVEVIRAGVIGTVTDVYTWCNKGWSDGRFEKTTQAAPANLDWDLWLGPARTRPYSPNIHPANWRRFWEYGSGTFGDMACHIMDLPFWALDLKYPTAVSAEGPPVHPDGAPAWVKAKYEFPAHGERPALTMYWSDGGVHHDPVKHAVGHNGKPLTEWGLGVLFVGEKGMLAADYGHYELLPAGTFDGFKPPAALIPSSIGHWREWATACKTGGPTTCQFGYSGVLTETVLLGVVAYRTGKRLEWDAEKLTVKNVPDANRLIVGEYRKGWEPAGIISS